MHRDDPPPMLAFDVPLNYLMDTDHCNMVTEEFKRLGTAWVTRKAVRNLWEQLPKKSGLYMFVWRPTLRFNLEAVPEMSFSWVLYVGRAGDATSLNTLRDRYRAEYSRYVSGDPGVLWNTSRYADRKDRLRRFLTLTPLEYWYTEVAERDKIQMLEKRILKILSPPLNMAGGPKLRSTKPVKAF